MWDAVVIREAVVYGKISCPGESADKYQLPSAALTLREEG
jgi:hypothetical protein